MNPPIFVVIEGIDGAGTTTQVQLLHKYFESEGTPTITTAEPSNGPIGQLLRQVLSGKRVEGYDSLSDPTTIAYLFATDRSDHCNVEILPAINDNKTVICDRYYYSSMVYQGIDPEKLRWVYQLNDVLARPNIVFFIDVDVQTAATRLQNRFENDGNREIYETTEQLERYSKSYHTVFDYIAGRRPLNPDYEKLITIDGNRSIEEVHASIIEELHCYFRRLQERDE